MSVVRVRRATRSEAAERASSRPRGVQAHDSEPRGAAAVERRTDRPVTVILGPAPSARSGTWPSTPTVRSPHRDRGAWTGSPIREQMEDFKHAYTAVLHLLHETFNGSPRLLAVATGLMYGLKDEAVKLMKLESGDGETTVGPPFEWVPREQRHLSGSIEPKIDGRRAWAVTPKAGRNEVSQPNALKASHRTRARTRVKMVGASNAEA